MVDVYVVIAQVCSVAENCWYDTFENIFLRKEDALRYALDKSNRCDGNEIKYNVEHITLE
jgi:hypothetical protein